MEKPPPYNPNASPHQGYPPPQQGYPPPQQGYPPSQQGYPPPQHGYPPPQQPVMVVSNAPAQQAPAPQTVVVTTQHVQQKRGVNHCLHCIISLFFFPWLLVWFCLCICE